MRFNHIIYTIIICFSTFSSYGQAMRKTIEGNNRFAFEIFKEVFNRETNVFLSPYSISASLAMTYAGARNETEKQMSHVLHYDLNQKITHEGFLAIESELNKLKNDSAITLAIANALWKDEAWHFNPDYIELTKKYYHASIFPLTNARAINDWVKKETNHKINELVTDQDLELARMVLTNAIYFKGDWLVSFNAKNTKKNKFFTLDNKEIEVDMMFQNNNVNYFEDENNQILELPYKGELISMFVILPKSNQSILNLVTNFGIKSFEDCILKFRKETVNIYLPEFSCNSEFELSDVLSKMGMPDAFKTERANFSGMSPGLIISKVKHKSFIEVNEKGSEAAAATAVIMTEKNAPIQKEIIFNANRPFMFLIKDNQTNSILFIGSMLNPVQ